MPTGTFSNFLDALLAFESGWDRERYDDGIIQDWQLTQWAGGPVTEFFPDYSSWNDLNDTEWETMAYQSTNSLGFVGFQFGEALLIDLGYYDDTVYYGAGASSNTWDGTWTGKNGVTSLDEFKTKAAQSVAIQEAFGFNLSIIEDGLANSGQSLDDFLGTSSTYTAADGTTKTVELTLTGIMAAAHLSGAYGTLNLLQNGAVSTDEYGTSILQYIDQFGGYDSPSINQAIDYFLDRLTGDEGLGGPGEGGPVPGSQGTAGVTKDTADIVVTWSYGSDRLETGFDPGTDTVFVDWISAENLIVSEINGSVVFEIPSNAQKLTIQGVSLADLSPSNFTILDASAAEKILNLVSGDPSPEPEPQPDPEPQPEPDPEPQPDPDPQPEPNSDASEFNNPSITAGNADVVVTWAYGTQTVVQGFDPAVDSIFVSWIGAEHLDLRDEAGSTVIAVPSNNQSITLRDVPLSALRPDGINALDASAREKLSSFIGGDGTTGHDGHTHMHVMIGLDSPSQTIDGFMPAMGDVIDVSADITAESFSIFEESGDALGTTVRIEVTQNGTTSQTILTGISLGDLKIGNFSAGTQGVLNEIAAVLGADVTPPETGGYQLVYDSDGSNPADAAPDSDGSGTTYRADTNADDIVGFDPAVDRLDFGGTSVHGMIVTKSEAGEIVIDSPWSDAAQIVAGVTYQDVSLSNFGVVGNEHFRQDMGGVISWEQSIGPRADDTVYVRSHEYGVSEVVQDFDPTSMKISFLYFGTRERLSVEDSDSGLVISSLPTGQSITFSGVSKADLVPGLVEFHHDQVIEDNLEDPFGFAQEDVTLVDRTMLLTPEGPVGSTTDGFQTSIGDMTGAGVGVDVGTDPGTEDGSHDDHESVGVGGTPLVLGAGIDVIDVTWNWGQKVEVVGFDPSQDLFDFHSLGGDNLTVSESDGDLIFEIVNNGGQSITIRDIEAEDLALASLTSDAWNPVLDPGSLFIESLANLGFDPFT